MPANAGIHVFAAAKKDVDGRDKPGHDERAQKFRWVAPPSTVTMVPLM
jgi:hypothetical protein